MKDQKQEPLKNAVPLESEFKRWMREVLIEQSQCSNSADDNITIDEAMKITHLARQTIYGHVFEKKIPFNKRPNSKKLFFSRKALQRWMLTGEIQ